MQLKAQHPANILLVFQKFLWENFELNFTIIKTTYFNHPLNETWLDFFKW